MRIIDGGNVCSAKGFQAVGLACGVKEGVKDMALVFSEEAASGAAVYTKNKVQAAPIQVCREHLADGSAKAVVLNSGNANACTGEEGLANARRMCSLTAEMLGLDAAEVLVCSTGVIGVQLPMEAIETGIPQAAEVLSGNGGKDAAEAIMTTDTVPKTFAVEVEIAGVKVRIGGMAKGSGMIAPNMATMLSVITTDADIAPELLRKQLGLAVRRSFNCITVDGDMSTNDTVIVLANGASGAPAIEGSGEAADDFYPGLEMVCRELARLIARDGEGATKLVSIRVNGAGNEAEARQVGLSVANSNLVKTAVFGRDPNWGRILCAVGYAGVELDPDKVAVSLCGTPIYGAGAGLDFDKDRLIEAMGAEDIPIEIDLGQGPEHAEIFTCDFSYDYVRINAEYTT